MKDREFTSKLRNILADNNVSRRNEREKSGMINSKRLALAPVSERVFSKRDEEKLEKDYNITLLLDTSGSMFGPQWEMARKAVANIAMCLEKVKGVQYEIISFSTMNITIKPYDEPFNLEEYKLITRDLVEDKIKVYYYHNKETGNVVTTLSKCEIDGYEYAGASGFSSSNHDAFCVADAYEKMKHRKGKKVILTFSDGAPTDDSICDIAEQEDVKKINSSRTLLKWAKSQQHSLLRLLTRNIQKNPEIELIGIGIKTDVVKHYYPNYAVVNDLEELFPATIKELSKVIKKV